MKLCKGGRPTRRRRASRPRSVGTFRCCPTSRAAALLMALAAIVVVGTLTSALGALVLAGVRSARNSSRDDALLNTAESGVELAISRLARDGAWPGSDRPPRRSGDNQTDVRRQGEAVAVPGGLCVVAVTVVTATVVAEGAFDVTSCSVPASDKPPGAASRTRSCTVRARIERRGPGFSVTDWDVSFEQ